MSDSYYNRAREVAQLELVNKQLQAKAIAMARWILWMDDPKAAFKAASTIVGPIKPEKNKAA